MSKDNIPLILIHYGDSFYLKYVIGCFKLTNPTKTIIFLGDEKNAYLADYGVTHINLNKYVKCETVKLFNEKFQLIAGVNHNYGKNNGTDYWVRFVFMRWFIIYECVKELGIEQFWTFDSDNMIVTDLSSSENDMFEYDCTTQCNGTCMNGFVNGLSIVKGYIDKIIELFNDEHFLNKQKKDMIKYPSFAFTEMRAFSEYKKSSPIKTIHLQSLDNGIYIFDDCLITSKLNTTFELDIYLEKNIKSVYFYQKMFCFKLKTGEFIQAMNFNLSWVDDFIFRIIYLEIYLLSKKRTTILAIFNAIFTDYGKKRKMIFKRSLIKRLTLRFFCMVINPKF